MKINDINSGINFNGTIRVRSVSDSHQEARRECKFLSKVVKDAKTNDNILLLNAGDLFMGVYSRELMKKAYLKLKELCPNIAVVIAMGNNDTISLKDKYVKEESDDLTSFEYYKRTIENFENNGINVVCANLTDKQTGDFPTWIKPYTIIEKDGERIFVTGFCINRIPNRDLGVSVISQEEAIDKLKPVIDMQKPDSIIVLNHDYSKTAEKLSQHAKDIGLSIDLIIGGHDHDFPKDIQEIGLYSPKAFSQSMFEMDLKIKDKVNQILNVKEIYESELDSCDEFEDVVSEYERESNILGNIAKYTLNLPKSYAHPGSLQTFIADNMCSMANTDVAFFSSNIIRISLPYKEDSYITNYDLRKVITFDTTIKKAVFTPDELKEILSSSVKDRIRMGEQNSKFLQCSSNIRIVGKGSLQTKDYQIQQIYLDGKPLFDDNGNALEPNRRISCAFDDYIPTDGRSTSLSNADISDVMRDNKKLRMDTILAESLVTAQDKYKIGMTYPTFILEETFE